MIVVLTVLRYLWLGELKSTLSKHTGPIFALKWNKKGDYLLTGSVDQSAIVGMWRQKNGSNNLNFIQVQNLNIESRENSIKRALGENFLKCYEWFWFGFDILSRSNTWCWSAQQCVFCHKFHRQYDICLQNWRNPPYKNFCWAPGLFTSPYFVELRYNDIFQCWNCTLLWGRVHPQKLNMSGKVNYID